MEILSSAELLIALSISFGIVVGVVVFSLLQRKGKKDSDDMSFPAYEYAIKKAQHTADEIVGEARKEARQIVAGAEVQSRQIIHDNSVETEKIRTVFLESLRSLQEKINTEMSVSANETYRHAEEMARLFADSLEIQEREMKEKLADISGRLQEMPDSLAADSQSIASELKERVARAGEQIELALQGIQEETRKQISSHIMKKFTEAEADIAAYRESREKLIDRYLETLIKDIVRLTLQKELTSDDHADLVRRALAEAKESSVL